MKKRRKLNHETMSTIINDSGASLITTFIENRKQKLEIKCKSCNHIYTQSFQVFDRKKSGLCPKCSILKYSIGPKRWTLNKVNEYIQSYGCELISEEYINSHEKLKIRCKCGNIFEKSLVVFKADNSLHCCSKCSKSETSTHIKEKYGQDVIDRINESGSEVLSDYNGYRNLLRIRCKCGNIFERKCDNTINRSDFYCSHCSSNISNLEKEVVNFVKSLNVIIVENTRKIINPYELDIYIPEHNLAIEFNGLYWHSELQGKGSDYHLMKTELCEEKGIQLLHIFESEWLNKKDIVKSIIKAKLGLTKHIYARKCEIKEVNKDDTSEFLINNHLQGKNPSKVSCGLYYENILVALMTFGKSRFDKNIEWELIRFANKKDISVVGGASKLLKYFNNKYQVKSLITYADRRYSNGNLYEQLGFKFSHCSKPNYFYFLKNDYELYSRQKFQKHKLSKLLSSFNPNLTEWENMKANKYNKIWDCGNVVYKI